ncbi:hypothetical protein TNCV_1152571 [Trichonephila clavipes]|nr:hypothetical protein TNCV_1152571 [Trichonephila clavipes]
MDKMETHNMIKFFHLKDYIAWLIYNEITAVCGNDSLSSDIESTRKGIFKLATCYSKTIQNERPSLTNNAATVKQLEDFLLPVLDKKATTQIIMNEIDLSCSNAENYSGRVANVRMQLLAPFSETDTA